MASRSRRGPAEASSDDVSSDLLDLGEISVAIAQGKVSGLPGTIAAHHFTTNASMAPLSGVGRQALNVLSCVGTDGVPDLLTQTGVVAPGRAARS